MVWTNVTGRGEFKSQVLTVSVVIIILVQVYCLKSKGSKKEIQKSTVRSNGGAVKRWFVWKETRKNEKKGLVPVVMPTLLLLRPMKRAGPGSHLPLRSNNKGKLMQT